MPERDVEPHGVVRSDQSGLRDHPFQPAKITAPG